MKNRIVMKITYESKVEQEIMELHRQAMEYADIGDYKKAFMKEKQVAMRFRNMPNFEPTRSIFFRSAASLAIYAELWDEAKEMIHLGSMCNTPGEIAEQLEELSILIPVKTENKSLKYTKSRKEILEKCLKATPLYGYPKINIDLLHRHQLIMLTLVGGSITTGRMLWIITEEGKEKLKEWKVRVDKNKRP